MGSTPVGSTPVGSTPVGSTSANRGGGVNEDGAIITAGQSGYATDRCQRLQRRDRALRRSCCAYRRRRRHRCRTARRGPGRTTPPVELPAPGRFRAAPDHHEDALHRRQAAADRDVREHGGDDAARLAQHARRTLRGRRAPCSSSTAMPRVRSAYTAWDATRAARRARNNVVRSINDCRRRRTATRRPGSRTSTTSSSSAPTRRRRWRTRRIRSCSRRRRTRRPTSRSRPTA